MPLEGLAYESGFWDKAKGLTPAAKEAINRLRALNVDSSFRVQFNANPGDHAVLVFVLPRSESSSILKVESGGRLMLMTYKHEERRVRRALDRLAHDLGWPEIRGRDGGEIAPDNLPTLYPGEWEHRIAEIIGTLRWLATEEAPAVATSPLRRRKGALGAADVPPTNTSPTPAPSSPPAMSPPGTRLGESPPVTIPPDSSESSPAGARTSEPLTDSIPSQVPEAALSEEDIEKISSELSDPKVRRLVSMLVRAKQSVFRDRLRAAYQDRCCVSGCGVVAILDAAHIEGHSVSGDSTVQNGLLLRTDLHELFDQGLLRIEPNSLRVSIHPAAQPWYGEYDGVVLTPPTATQFSPDREKLRSRWENPAKLT